MLTDEALIEVFNRDGPSAAETAARAVLASDTTRTVAIRVLGAALLQLGRLDEALATQARLLTAQAAVDDLVNYAVTLRRLGRLDEAIKMFRLGLAANPDHVSAPVNLGTALMSAGRLDEADAVLSQALTRRPGDGDLLANRGSVRYAAGDMLAAERDYREAYALGVRRPELLSGLGALLVERGRLTEAETLLRMAIAAAPALISAHVNLAICLTTGGQAEAALPCVRRALEIDPLDLVAHSALMMLSNYLPAWSVADVEAACEGTRRASRRLARPNLRPLKRPTRERLRVGLVSGDLRQHPVGYFLVGVLEQARRDIDFRAYPTTSVEDALTARIRAACQEWTPIGGLSDPAAAERIRADELDVLLDLSGHTSHNRLGVFAAGAAPAQASWLGYSATTGLPEMDYFIGDAVVAPVEEQARFVETLVALPTSYLCYCPPADAPPVAPAPILARGHATFGCFNKLSKLNPAVVDAWARILHGAPSSRLLLQTDQLADPGVVARVRGWFDVRGVGDRVALRPAKGRADYFADFADVDIVLDPFPFPGGTTTFDALWMGTPTVTLAGDRFLARAGASFARSAGLEDWVAATVDDYVALALRKAADAEALNAARAALRDRVRNTSLFDAARFAEGFVALLGEIARGDGL